MWLGGPLASFGNWITYILQVILGYLTTLLICAVIQNARTRVRVWGGFLSFAISAWAFLWIPFQVRTPVYSAFRAVPLPARAALHIAVPVEGVWVWWLTRIAPLAANIYFFMLLVIVLHFLIKLVQLKSFLERTQPPSPQLELRFRRLCLELKVEGCELGLVSELRSPATCCWWRSYVLLPMELVPYLEGDQLDDALRHELVHVRQHDYLWDRLAALGCRMVFFHPLVWLGYRHLRRERELACDFDVVKESREVRLRYAECLTTLARWFISRGSLSPGISFLSSDSLLAVRVRALLSEPPVCSVPRKMALTGFVLTIGTVAFLLVSGLGLSLYSAIHPTSVLARTRNTLSASVRRRVVGAKPAHSFMPVSTAVEGPSMAPQSTGLNSINSLVQFQRAPLPALDSSTRSPDTIQEDPARGQDDAGLRRSHNVWDEAPMPLARAPKWRSVVIGAITGGVGLAAGRIDVDDDDDGPHKKSR
jgi:beta-lactamase regulating signal transducer with metallopeptidase domain